MPGASFGVAINRGFGLTRRALLAGGVLLAGCSTTATAPDFFPAPVMTPLPITAGVRYTDEFRDYSYTEAFPGEHKWVVIMGSANVAMFNSILDSVFQKTVPLDGTEAPRALSRRVDVIIQPEVESYEFAAPADWGTHSFTVWITYRINVLTPQGDLITSWPVRAYGESRHRLFSADESLAEATTMAMRDAGAYVSLHFDDEPRIREWLREESARMQSGPRFNRRPGERE
jgi:hypothetical protein